MTKLMTVGGGRLSAYQSHQDLQGGTRGQLPAFRIGSDWRLNIEEIDRWCSEQQAERPAKLFS